MSAAMWLPWALLISTMCGAAPPPRADPRLSISLDCSDWRFVLRVSLDLFATGRPVDASSLHLGAPVHACGFTSKDPDHPVVVFDYGLLDCGSERILTNQSIVYSNPFYHVPLGEMEGDEAFNYSVECDYPRRGSVSFEKDLLPQREGFSSLLEDTASLHFSLTIMDDEWQGPRSSATFLLGGAVNLEARVEAGGVGGGHPPLRLFLDSCIATPGGGGQGGGQAGGGGGGDLEYALVEQHGCLVDSKSSAAVFVRPEDPASLRLSFQAFAFANNSGSATNEIYLHCDLHVADSQDDYSPAQKTCSFDQVHSEWRMEDDVALSELCACCDGDCEDDAGQLQRRRRHAGQPAAGVSALGGGGHQRLSVGPVRVRSGALGHVAWAWLRGPSPRAASTHTGSTSPSSLSPSTKATATLLCILSAIVAAVSAVSYALSKGLCHHRLNHRHNHRSTSVERAMPLAETWCRLPVSALPCTDLSAAGGGAAACGGGAGGAAVL